MQDRHESRAAVSYTRFSDPKQSKGDSADRQARLFTPFCQRHRLTPAKEYFADHGLSGYKGTHRKKGDLGRFEQLVREGTITPGTVLVIEAWDRLSRERPDKVIALIASLLGAGVDIGVCRLDDIFTEDDLGTHKFTTLSVFVQLAYQESKQKAERVAESWAKRRKQARQDRRPMTTCLPAWVEVKNGSFRLIPRRASVIRRIFGLAARGYGHTKIVGQLDKEKVPPFGEQKVKPGRRRSQFSGKWTKPYVARILNDKRVLGQFQPCGADRRPSGPTIADYLPAVVTEEQYLLARAGQERRNTLDRKGRKTGPRQRKYLNLFAGLLKHARDGEGWLLHNKGTAESPELVLVNARGNGGRGKSYTVPYPVFETALLSCLQEIDPTAILSKTTQDQPARRHILEVQLKDTQEQIAELTADLAQGYSRALTAVLREKETLEARLKQEIEEEQVKAAHKPEKDWAEFKDLAQALAAADDPEDARLRLRGVLRRVIESIWVLAVPRGRTRLYSILINFGDGRIRDILLLYRPAANHCEGRWNYATAGNWETPDLSDREQAGQVEDGLLAYPQDLLDRLLVSGHPV